MGSLVVRVVVQRYVVNVRRGHFVHLSSKVIFRQLNPGIVVIVPI
jgi:hypothetical protein